MSARRCVLHNGTLPFCAGRLHTPTARSRSTMITRGINILLGEIDSARIASPPTRRQ
jgi:hypothetical protein